MTAGDPAARHQRAVANTLAWADEAAQSGRYSDALSWLSTVESIGEVLPDEYLAKRSAWVSLRSEPESTA